MKVLFVLPRMVSGGVERVTLSLIGQFLLDGIECRIALRHCRGELVEEARALVKVDELAPSGLHQFVPNLAKLLQTWEPTCVVTAFADVAALTWAAMHVSKTRAKWVHGVHNTHAAIAARPGIMGRIRHSIDNLIAKHVYRHADKVIAVSEGVRNEIIQRFGIEQSRVVRIYNPVVPEEELRSRSDNLDKSSSFRAVAIGRLAWQKGFDVLIEAMARVREPCRLDIYGEGPERAHLRQLISLHGLQSVHLRGYAVDPFAVLRTADLFVLPSRYEGLANVVAEALACQCQVVSTDCLQGPREVLLDGELGQLVPVENSEALAEAIERAIAKKNYVAPERLLERARTFSVVESARAWQCVLQDLSYE
jgi:glycosyltransferase involved in cell wall biosynthesis